jgi:integrase
LLTSDGIVFKPTKTEKKAGTKVRWPLTTQLEAVLATAKRAATMGSMYVISNELGQPYTTHGIATLFIRACKRAGIKGITLKDIRSMASTDAIQNGYSREQLKLALAHTDMSTTNGYIRNQVAPVSEIVLSLPCM